MSGVQRPTRCGGNCGGGGVPSNRVLVVLAGKRAVTADNAVRLGKTLGTRAGYVDPAIGSVRP